MWTNIQQELSCSVLWQSTLARSEINGWKSSPPVMEIPALQVSRLHVYNTRWISVYIRLWYTHNHKGRCPAQHHPDSHQPTAGGATGHHCSDGGPDPGVQQREPQPRAAAAIHQHNVHPAGEGWWDCRAILSDILPWPEESLCCTIIIHSHYQGLPSVINITATIPTATYDKGPNDSMTVYSELS